MNRVEMFLARTVLSILTFQDSENYFTLYLNERLKWWNRELLSAEMPFGDLETVTEYWIMCQTQTERFSIGVTFLWVSNQHHAEMIMPVSHWCEFTWSARRPSHIADTMPSGCLPTAASQREATLLCVMPATCRLHRQFFPSRFNTKKLQYFVLIYLWHTWIDFDNYGRPIE